MVNITVVLLKQIIIMFALMGIGFFLYRRKMITDQGSKDIGRILLYIVIPVVIISSYWVASTPEKTRALLDSSLIGCMAMVLSIAVSWLVFKKKDGIACFSSSFSNAGFIGIPLVQAVLGDEAVFYISVMIVFVNLLQWTVGCYMISGQKSAMKPKAVIKNPVVISVALGIVLYCLNLPCPAMAATLFASIKGLNTPLAMIVSGVYLAQSDLVKMFTKRASWTVCLFRLAVIPALTLLLFWVLPFGEMSVKLAVLLAAACPVGSNVAVFAQQYNADYTEAVEHVCLSTLACLITLPIIVAAASLIL